MNRGVSEPYDTYTTPGSGKAERGIKDGKREKWNQVDFTCTRCRVRETLLWWNGEQETIRFQTRKDFKAGRATQAHTLRVYI